MGQYIANRLLQAIPVFFIIGAITFVLMRVPAGDPVTFLSAENPEMTKDMIDALREDLGLHRPLVVQYLDWQWGVIRGDLGYSYLNGFSVLTLIGQRLPKSIELALFALMLGLPIALVSGVLAAVFRGSWIDNIVTAFVTAGISIPSFWLAIMLIIVLCGEPRMAALLWIRVDIRRPDPASQTDRVARGHAGGPGGGSSHAFPEGEPDRGA